ncbi:M48 family metallopeptidase [Robiginitalea aurantiaca]|uniref:M48 family metallopeptidase n=1 Tax=Robiginitalea aurantiaca TaxID=3056915 RepID=A0ABT7WGJ4_9FLAO|nr:M48 family metallopeptidase [Robiginitalea aurantiaca]MDM9632042.1 M48 family metallopeptidase [Robiginitalea aurantiaca]
MTSETLLYAIVGILILDYFLDTVLEMLNARRFSDPVPAELEGIYDPEEYLKSQQYKKVNYRFGLLSSGLSLAVTLLFLLSGGFGWLDALAGSITPAPIPHALIFFGLIFLGSDLLSTPFSYYHTFVIEERFGFNKSTPALFFADKIKGWGLLMFIGGGILALIMWFYAWAGIHFWLYAWGLITLFTLVMNLFYSRLIVPLFNKQVPLESGGLKSRIEKYVHNVGFELKNIFVIDGSKRSTKANAYFSGFGREKRVALYDTLIDDLKEEEIVAVLAHEVGHYKKHHILFNLFASIILTGLTLYILSLFINHPELSLAIGVKEPSFHASLLGFGMLYSPISELTGLVMNYFSRKFEYQADRYARQTYAAQPLIDSLKKLSRKNLSNLTPHPAYVFVHYSHPPLIKRIRALNKATH